MDGSNNFVCLESRDDVKRLMRDHLSTGRDDVGRKKKDPIPKFLYETLYREQRRAVPDGHYRELIHNLLPDDGYSASGTFRRLCRPSRMATIMTPTPLRQKQMLIQNATGSSYGRRRI